MASSEETRAQVQRIGIVHGAGEATLRPRSDSRTWYRKVREMRRDPTVSLVRRLVIAPALAAEISIETTLQAGIEAPEGAVELIKSLIEPMRIHIIDTAFRGCIDFGWQPYELVYDVDDSGQYIIKKMKPLLQDFTEILVDEQTGAYAGLRQGGAAHSAGGQGGIELDIENTFLHSWDVEGTDWYGEALMRAVEGPYDQGVDVAESAMRYDRKIAGSHWVIYYPIGRSKDKDGNEKDNGEIAQDILKALSSVGSVSIPNSIDPTAMLGAVGAAGKVGWDIELVTDGGASTTAFNERSKYLDALKARAFGVPERAVLEGQFGTKAEAEAHGDMAVVIVGMRNQMLWQGVNWHIVNRILRFNYGPEYENTVFCKPAPLTEYQRAYFRTLYSQLLASPDVLATESAEIDFDALRDGLGVPSVEHADMGTLGGLLDDILRMPSANGDTDSVPDNVEDQVGA